MRKNTRGLKIIVTVLSVSLLILAGLGNTALGAFNFDPIGIIVESTSVELEVGETKSIDVTLSPEQEDQPPTCGMADCPEICGGESCLDENGWCTCGGTTYAPYYSEASIEVANPSVASAFYSNGKIEITGNAEGETTVTVTGKLRHHVDAQKDISVQVIAETGGGSAAPSLTPDSSDNTVGQAVYITFTDDEAWRGAITGISVNAIPLTGEQYAVTAGSISLVAGIFTQAGEYTIVVTATDYEDAGVIQIMNEAAAPAAPANLSATAGDGQVTLTWDAVDGATSYSVYMGTAAGEYGAAPVAAGITATSYTATALTNGTTYYFAVTAVNTGGESGKSAEASATPLAGNKGVYTVTPIADTIYQIGTTEDGIATMTVNSGVSGLKYFSVRLAPVISHPGQESVIFVHFHGGIQESFNITIADLDLVEEAQAGFNVEGGDMVKIYVVDQLTNSTESNPIILQ